MSNFLNLVSLLMLFDNFSTYNFLSTITTPLLLPRFQIMISWFILASLTSSQFFKLAVVKKLTFSHVHLDGSVSEQSLNWLLCFFGCSPGNFKNSRVERVELRGLYKARLMERFVIHFINGMITCDLQCHIWNLVFFNGRTNWSGFLHCKKCFM